MANWQKNDVCNYPQIFNGKTAAGSGHRGFHPIS